MSLGKTNTTKHIIYHITFKQIINRELLPLNSIFMELKAMKEWLRLLEELDISSDDKKEIITQVVIGTNNFGKGNYRFISKHTIDKILAEELESDLYILGCFNANFISERTDLPVEMIEACQQAEAFESIGQGILATCGIEIFSKAYSDTDGFGNHFATYNGEEIEHEDYYIFRIN